MSEDFFHDWLQYACNVLLATVQNPSEHGKLHIYKDDDYSGSLANEVSGWKSPPPLPILFY